MQLRRPCSLASQCLNAFQLMHVIILTVKAKQKKKMK